MGRDGLTVNRRLSLRWFEPNTCHYLRKQPVSWGYSPLCGLSGLVSSPVTTRRCAAVVTDIWVRHEALLFRVEVRDRPSSRRRSGGMKLEAA
jgi:hypothetical protein